VLREELRVLKPLNLLRSMGIGMGMGCGQENPEVQVRVRGIGLKEPGAVLWMVLIGIQQIIMRMEGRILRVREREVVLT